MKKIIPFFAFLLFTFEFVNAQAPQATSYQAVIRNSSGNVLANQLVKVRFSIRDSAANGTVVYQETQTPTTNAQGLINLFAGQGTAVTGTFSGINWGSKSKFLQTEIDTAGGNNYTDMGTMQLMSVPYALYANTSSNGMPSGTTAGEMLYWNGTTWVKIIPGNNGQNLTFCNGVPQWGPCLILPTVLTGSITAKTAITATAGGNVTDSGSAKITARGVCFSTTINPTIANTKTASGTNVIGAYTVSITGLSALTTYHYRAYATTSVGTSYGADSVFTTNAATVPALTTTAASAITGITATSGGNITSDNGATITARGICWSTTANPTTALTTKTIDGTGTGAFISSITGLTTNTLYYVRAYATNSAGTAYGTQVSFSTLRLPSVTTGAVSNITSSKATASGNVTDSGSRAIVARGVCYAITPNPLITNSFVSPNGTNTTGNYNVSLTGLSASTRYYVRAYVTTSVGTSYGVDSVLTTASGVVNLPSVTIGTQVWTTQNLSVARYRNGDIIPQVTSAQEWAALSTTGAWCWYRNDSANNAATYGRLYNWYAVNDPRGLAPEGYHIPSNAEWITLETTLGGASIAGGTMKSTTGWVAPNTGATNSSGFTGQPGGFIDVVGQFGDKGYAGNWWSSTQYDTSLAWYRELSFLNSNVVRYSNSKSLGLSVRCIRDTTIIPTLPNLITSTSTNITTTTITSGGIITTDGGATIFTRGVCWSTTVNPTVSLTTKTVDGSGVGAFTSSIIGLIPNTIYYVRAYATNSLGTFYGAQQTFTTASVLAVADLPRVTIGTQIWSSKNLNVVNYRNGDIIPQVTDANEWRNLFTGAWCWYNNDSATYAATYGRLYNWYAVNDARGFAPFGWHVPSDGEWTILENYLGGSEIAGGAMKSTTSWNSPNTGANNRSGFSALPGGSRGNFGTFSNIGNEGNWWSSTEDNFSFALSRQLFYNDVFVINFFDSRKSFGISVRCLRDTTIIPIAPTLTTTPTNINTNSATSGGNITSDGGAAITARGVCWSTTTNPTVSLSTKTVDGSGTGAFTSSINGLTANTTYYVRAYATNSVGTAYGAQQTFTILPSVTIGTQVWTNQNLSVARYRNGDIIPQVTNPTQWAALTTGAWCWYNNDSVTYAATYGRLYNWSAVNDARGLAPQGWHVPSDAEWNKLVKYLDPGADTTCVECAQSSIAGGVMKSTTGWNAPNSGATNSSGFAGRPGAFRDAVGAFGGIGDYGNWWSSSENNTLDARYRNLYFINSTVGRRNFTKLVGFSVRCVRD